MAAEHRKSRFLCRLDNVEDDSGFVANTVGELIDYVRANDGKVNYRSSGNGTSSHLSSVMF